MDNQMNKRMFEQTHCVITDSTGENLFKAEGGTGSEQSATTECLFASRLIRFV